MPWASLLLVCIKLVSSLATWASNAKLITAGERAAVADALKVQLDELLKANAAADAVRDDLDQHPDRLRDDDGFEQK